MAENGVNTPTTKKLHRTKEQKVYDLDTAPSMAGFDSSLLAVKPSFNSLHDGGEIPQGMLLCGYDNVDDAVAALTNVEPETINSGALGQNLSVTIELPVDPLIAGDKAFGTIALRTPSLIDTVIYLNSSAEHLLKLPDSVTVARGETKTTFPIETRNPGQATAKVHVQAMLPDDTLFNTVLSVRYNLGLWVR